MADLERRSGFSRIALESAATVYARASKVIGRLRDGLYAATAGAPRTVRMLANLLLLRGNIGKPGAGICPVRGHSNVQGQRTVGITEKPELAPNDKLRELYGFEPPMEKGLNTVETCEGISTAACARSSGLAATSCGPSRYGIMEPHGESSA